MLNTDGFGDIDPSLTEPREGDVIESQSGIEKHLKCSAQLAYRRDPGTVDYPSEPITFGWTVHALLAGTIEGTLPDYWETVRPWQAQFLVDTFDAEVMRGYPQYRGRIFDFTTKENVEAMAEEAVRAVQMFHREYEHIGWLNAVAVEENMARQMGTLPDGRGVWLRGSPDLVTPVSLYDWKTAGRPWSEGKGLVRIQGPLYVWLAEEYLTSLDVPMHYFVFDRKSQEWDVHSVEVTEISVQASLAAAWQFALQKAYNVYPPTPAYSMEQWGKLSRAWWCSAKWCPAWNVCQFKGMIPDDKDLDEVREELQW